MAAAAVLFAAAPVLAQKPYAGTATGTLTVDGKIERLGPGDRCFIPRGAVHHFINEGTQRTRTLAVVTPALLGPAYFSDIAALLAGGGPPDPARVAEVMRRHGLVAVPPTAPAR